MVFCPSGFMSSLKLHQINPLSPPHHTTRQTYERWDNHKITSANKFPLNQQLYNLGICINFNQCIFNKILNRMIYVKLNFY